MKICATFWLILLIWLINSSNALAQSLAERLAHFPDWQGKPSLSVAEGDLIYPDWMAGTWHVTSTLVDLAAPLAPQITTPGLSSNRQYLNQPVEFRVQFIPKRLGKAGFPFALKSQGNRSVVANRAFNGLQIAQAYLGSSGSISVIVDPDNPNRQLTRLGSNRQLIATIVARRQETPAQDQFMATELTNQVFRNQAQVYINEVETTTAYQLLSTGQVVADQVTAIYLSPQDPDYFTANGRPVALYRYQLEMEKGKFRSSGVQEFRSSGVQK